jgi:hypothetical protein
LHTSKKCFKCELVKPLTEFYKHAQMTDGHLNKCKDCAKSDVTKNRCDNIDRIREYDRTRGKEPHRIKNTVKQTKAWRDKDKRRNKAHEAVARALKKGTLQKQDCCRCQSPKTIAHHENYDFPLDVVWLCQPCHKQRHKEIEQEKANSY